MHPNLFAALKIAIIHLHYNTPYSGGPQRSYYLSTEFQKHGLDCEVITAHNSMSYMVQKIDGVTVHFLPVYYKNKYGFLRRIFAFWKFNAMVWHFLKKNPHFDALYTISTPLTIGSLGLKSLKRFKIPYYFEIGDLWPEAPIQMGVIRNRWVIKYLRRFERKIYLNSRGIVSLSPSIAKQVAANAPYNNRKTIPNFADIEYFSDTSECRKFQFFDDERFIISSCGAIGKANHLEYLIDLARYAEQHEPRLGFVIMGEGSERKRLEKRAKGLKNIKFLAFAPRPYVREVLHSSDAVYISYRKIPVLETGSPNKLFDALASGKTVITNFGGWIPELLEKHDCGFRTNPSDHEQAIEKIKNLIELPKEEVKRKREASMELAKQFELKTKTKELAEWILTTSDISF